MGNSKIPYKPYTHVIFHYVTLGNIIKASSHQLHFGEINNDPSNVDTTFNSSYTGVSGDDDKVRINLSKRDKIYPSDTQKELSSTK